MQILAAGPTHLPQRVSNRWRSDTLGHLSSKGKDMMEAQCTNKHQHNL